MITKAHHCLPEKYMPFFVQAIDDKHTQDQSVTNNFQITLGKHLLQQALQMRHSQRMTLLCKYLELNVWGKDWQEVEQRERIVKIAGWGVVCN